MTATTCPAGYASCNSAGWGEYRHTVTHADDGYVTIGTHSHKSKAQEDAEWAERKAAIARSPMGKADAFMSESVPSDVTVNGYSRIERPSGSYNDEWFRYDIVRNLAPGIVVTVYFYVTASQYSEREPFAALAPIKTFDDPTITFDHGIAILNTKVGS